MSKSSNTIPHQRRLLRRFIVISVALHLIVILGGIVPTMVRRAQAARQAAEARERDKTHAKEMHDQEMHELAAAKHDAATQAVESTREQVKAALKDQFDAVVGEQLKGDSANAIWEDILAQLNAGLDGYSEQLTDSETSDADVREEMTQLQAKMLEELAKRLREMGTKQLADQFVSRVQGDVAPKLIEFYRQQLANKLGNALRDQGAQIVRDDAADVIAHRQAVEKSLSEAEQQARAAREELTNSKQRLADAIKSAGTTADAPQKVNDAAKAEQASADKAAAAIEAARTKLAEAAGKADALSRPAGKSIADASGNADGVKAQVAKAQNDAKEGKAGDFSKSSADAADAAGKLAEAIHTALDTASKDNSIDAGTEARLAEKHARDDEIKDLVEHSFWDNYGKRAAPRLGEKLTGVFRQTLDDAGIKDDAAVADVKKRVEAALVDKVRDKINAGEAATDPLSKDQHLDELADPRADGRKNGKPSAGPATPHPAGEEGPSARETAIVGKISKSAHDLVGQGMTGIGDDAGNDEAIAGIARGGAPARKAEPGDEPGDTGIAGLAGRVGQLAENVKAGRTDLDDALHSGGAAGAKGSGAAGPGAGIGLARMRQNAFERLHGPLLRPHYRTPDEAKYAQLTQGIHDRDKAAAQGEATTRRSADGVAAMDAALSSTPDPALRPAAVLLPHATTEPVGDAEHKEPFKPSFKSIRFAAIPYRSKPVTIDGDLSEWAEVPALPMTPSIYGAKPKPEEKQFPQAVKLQWDNTGFYLAYDVKDADNKITKANPANFWEGDGVEFWVDTLNTKEKYRVECTHQFWAWVDGSAKDPNLIGGEAQRWGGKDDYIGLTKDVIKTASKKTPDGWTIEFFVPASRFRMLDLQPGRVLGMNCSICTGTDLYYYWAGTTDVATARRPDTWGDILLAGSAGKLECVDRLASELKQTESAKPLNAIRIGEPLRVRVTDPDMNLSNSAKDKVAVVATTPRGGRQTIILEETTETSGIFEGAIRTAADTGQDAQVAGVLFLLDGDPVDLSYTDQCRPDGARDVRVKLRLPTAAAVTAASLGK